MKGFIIALVIAVLWACGSGKDFTKEPVDDIIRDNTAVSEMSIILFDMKEEGTFSPDYFHKYQIIKTIDSVPKAETTDWLPVSEDYFFQHEEDMGMEIVSKKDGKLNKVVSPAGYANYIGNEKYGSWQQSNSGSSFWQFYGQYAFMSSMFNLMAYPAYRSYHSAWGGAYGRGNSYYGPNTNGRSYYGTYSDHNSNRRGGTYTKSNAFQNRVQDRTMRSSGSGSRSSGRSSSRSTRSGSRFNSQSSSRSRGGGFGK